MVSGCCYYNSVLWIVLLPNAMKVVMHSFRLDYLPHCSLIRACFMLAVALEQLASRLAVRPVGLIRYHVKFYCSPDILTLIY